MKINLSEKAYEKIFQQSDISPQQLYIKLALDDIG